MLIALADLGGAWELTEVTHALSDLADRLLGRAVRLLLRAELATGKLPGQTHADLETDAGYVVIAMGKHGARELNYSSDIDLICLFDQSRFEPDTFAEVKARFIRLTRNLVKLLSEPTGAGYVFRTDLRLRPSPSTTPVCLAMEAAERYYESVGRTWERAAHIKARPVAGDIGAGRAYLARLRPFVWRRYLDFAAIEDTHGILQKIRETKGTFATEALAGTDIKQAPGGIREIEFFAQTRQLIQGGRMPELREPTTLGALAALARAEIIPGETAEALSADYIAHRTLEHRLQMIEDAQTHTVPSGEEGRRRVAALMGARDQAAWEAEISVRLHRVHTTVARFFEPDQGPAAAPAPTAPQDSDLAALGFTRPEDSLATISRWRRGAIPATRDGRAQRLYAGLEPRILRELAEAGDPDAALIQFDRFLGGLPAGVQLFSLFNANPHLLDLIVRICALAPRLAGYLGRQPQVLDALLEPDFFQPLPDLAELRQTLAAQTDPIEDYERVLDTARRSAR
ncbi:MAG: glutamine-synthetase adenylyltransferase, partial [Pseudomonadota bacterium]